MESKEYKVTLSNGKVFEGLKLNGTNFISNYEIKSEMFDGGCSPVVINNSEKDETHARMELVQVTNPGPNEWWFVLRDFSEKEVSRLKMKSDIDYLAMMSGVAL